MSHFDGFQEKDGYESTKPLDVLPNTPIWKFGVLWKKSSWTGFYLKYEF